MLTIYSYYLSERKLRKLFKNEYNDFARAIAKKSIPKNENLIEKEGLTEFTTNIELNKIKPIESGKHKIEISHNNQVSEGAQIIYYNPNENGSVSIIPYNNHPGDYFNYTLKTWGILTDQDMVELTQAQNVGQSTIIALACLQHQIKNN